MVCTFVYNMPEQLYVCSGYLLFKTKSSFVSMSDEQSGTPEPPESADDNSSREQSEPETTAPKRDEPVSTWGAWLVIGCLGISLLLAGVTFFGGIVYLILADEDEDDVAPEPTPVAEAPTPTQAPEEPAPTPDPDQPASFGPGIHTVGEDIQAGIYFANHAEEFCYWERLSDFSGEAEDIIANQISDYRAIVEIQESDAGFSSERCGEWEREANLDRDDPTADLEAGIYLVPNEVAPGRWQSEAGGDSCYWARLSGFTSDLDDIITNGFGQPDPIVEIREDDAGFESSECGTWVYLGE